jgi:hypothetical protein
MRPALGDLGGDILRLQGVDPVHAVDILPKAEAEFGRQLALADAAGAGGGGRGRDNRHRFGLGGVQQHPGQRQQLSLAAGEMLVALVGRARAGRQRGRAGGQLAVPFFEGEAGFFGLRVDVHDLVARDLIARDLVARDFVALYRIPALCVDVFFAHCQLHCLTAVPLHDLDNRLG